MHMAEMTSVSVFRISKIYIIDINVYDMEVHAYGRNDLRISFSNIEDIYH